MATDAILNIVTKVKGGKQVSVLRKEIGGLSAGTKLLGATLGAVSTGAMALFLRSSTEAASVAQETQNLFETSFGSMAGEAEEWAQRTQAAVGVNDTTLKQMSGTLFQITSNMGLTKEAAFSMATGFTQAALDASSFFNVPFDTALQKIRAGLIGSSEPLLEFGIDVRENAILQTEFAQKIQATGRELTNAEKVQARAIVIANGLGSAQNDLIDTQDSWANQTRIVSETWTDLQETVGEFITSSPEVGRILGTIVLVIQKMRDTVVANSDAIKEWVRVGFVSLLEVIPLAISGFALLKEAVGGVVAGAGTAIVAFAELGLAINSFSEKMPGALVGFTLFNDEQKASAESAAAFGRGLEESGAAMFHNAQVARDLSANTKQALSEIVAALDEEKSAVDENSQSHQTWQNLLESLQGTMTDTAGATGELTKEQQKQLDQTEKLAQQIGTAGLVGETNQLLLAIKELDGQNRLSASGYERIIALIQQLRENGLEVPPVLREITKEFIAQSTVIDEASERYGNFIEQLPGVAESTDEVTESTEKQRDAMEAAGSVLSNTTSVLNAFGVESDSVAGKVLSFGQTAIDVFSSVLGIIKDLTGGIGGLGSTLGGLGGLLGGGGGLGGLGGLGDLLGGLGGIPGLGLIAGLGGAAIAGLAGAFTREASAETTAEALGINFDALPGHLQDTLQTMGEQIGDFATAISANLDDIFLAGGLQGGANELAERFGDTFSLIDQGVLDAAGATDILGQNVDTVIQQVQNMGVSGVQQLERILSAAERTGVSFEGMDRLAEAYVKRAQELGVSVNNVTLEALGLDSALGLLGSTSETSFSNTQDQADSLKESVSGLKQELIDTARAAADVNLPGGGASGPDVFSAQFGTDRIMGPGGGIGVFHPNERVIAIPGGGGGGALQRKVGNINITIAPQIDVPEGTPETQARAIQAGVVRLLKGDPEIRREVTRLVEG